MFRLKFNIKRKIYSFQKKYFLKIMREENNIEKEYMKRQIIMDLPYTNDDEV